ncbi:MAG: SH3 domain-containing protein [Alphaproteobacteria bacterium]|jgi:SH3-like domain-containing protein
MRHGIMAALAAAAALLCLNAASASDAPALGPDSNLPVPRFVSLKAEGANGRRGPGLEHQVEWVYERAGLPLQVTGESGPWRRVVDPAGDQVWIHAQNLDQRRTAYVQEAVALRRHAREGAQIVAYLAPGVVAGFTGCEGAWRRVTIGGRIGWVEADALWGAECASGG